MTNIEEPLPSAQRAEMMEQEQYYQQLYVALLPDEAADRESELQMQLDKMKNDVSKLRMRLKQRSNLQKEFDDFKWRSAPLWEEQEMKQRDSRFNRFQLDNLSWS